VIVKTLIVSGYALIPARQLENQMFKIEKGVAIRQSKGSKYPFELMEVGDSFLAPSQESAHSACRAYRVRAKSPGFSISTQKEGDSHRVWRTA
jgi:hypothetical protein